MHELHVIDKGWGKSRFECGCGWHGGTWKRNDGFAAGIVFIREARGHRLDGEAR